MFSPTPAGAKDNKGDTYLAEGRKHESKKEWDAAVSAYQRALDEDSSNLIYKMALERARFQCGQAHIETGLKLRQQGELGEALLELQRAAAVNPGSSIAFQELQLTRDMIERERKRIEAGAPEASSAERGLTPLQLYRNQENEQLDQILAVPKLKPLNAQHIDLKMNSKTHVLFDTVAKYAGINLIWDPEYQLPSKDSFNVEFDDSTIDQALDYLCLVTKSYWKPISSNTIFVTNDNQTKRRDYEEWVTKTFYLQNVLSQQELLEIVNAVRTVTDIGKIFQVTGQYAVVVRGETDKVELAGKLLHDLDKPKPEVLVDVMVIEASSTLTRQLTTALASTGLNVPFSFSPRGSIQVQNSSTTSSSTSSSTSSATASSSSSSSASGTSGTYIPLSSLGHLSSADFATTLPGAVLQAAMSDAKTKILQAPQLRSVDNMKATLNIGEREPIATGAYQSGVSGVAVSSLVSTQFQYIDVGVNVELTPRVHENGDVTMHIKIDISNVANTVTISGVDEPVIGQRKIEHDIRMREGEVGLLGGLVNTEDDKTVTGIPGLDKIPLLRRFFTGDSATHNRDELMIVVVPHVIRRLDITPENLRAIASGSQATVKLTHAESTDSLRLAAAAPLVPAELPTAPPVTAPPLTVAGPRARFSVPELATEAGKTFQVSVLTEPGQELAAAAFTFKWDPSVLQLTSASPGAFFRRDGHSPAILSNIQNDKGVASIDIGPLAKSVTSAKDQPLITLTFQPLTHGNTQLAAPQIQLRDSHGAITAISSSQMSVTVK